jgi:putative copper resistance protein D
METDWPVVAIRLALYADLGLLFGAPLFGLYGLRGEERSRLLPFRALTGGLALAGVLLSLVGFALLAASMTGTGLAGLDRATMGMLVAETPVGWAFAVREAVLLLAAALCIWPPRPPHLFLALASVLGAIAVATLAWSGHAAATEGSIGVVHLAGDIVHLLAASAWIGALAMFGLLTLTGRGPTDELVRASHRALAGFATAGSILVGLIVLTGIANGAFLIGIDQLLSLGSTLYGQLLLAKIALFLAMGGLAARHRYRLTPALSLALDEGDPASALAALRRSLFIELALGVAILGIVAWLGTLPPPISGE